MLAGFAPPAFLLIFSNLIFVMNEDQQGVLGIAAFVFVLMLVFPPTNCRWNSGYKFIFKVVSNSYCSVDIPLLFIQWLCVAVVAGIAYFAVGKTKGE